MAQRTVIVTIVVAAIFAAAPVLEESVAEREATHLEVGLPSEWRVQVLRVIDGDTIEVAMPDGTKEIVRYIGVNSPELVYPVKSPQNGGAASAFNWVNLRRAVQCFGEEAAERNRIMMTGQEVMLVRDVSERDRYGRLLRYVYLNDSGHTFVNLELVRQGYAVLATYPPDISYAANFLAAEREARAAARGLWGICR